MNKWSHIVSLIQVRRRWQDMEVLSNGWKKKKEEEEKQRTPLLLCQISYFTAMFTLYSAFHTLTSWALSEERGQKLSPSQNYRTIMQPSTTETNLQFSYLLPHALMKDDALHRGSVGAASERKKIIGIFGGLHFFCSFYIWDTDWHDRMHLSEMFTERGTK